MDLTLLFFYGAVFSVVVVCIRKPELLVLKKEKLFLRETAIEINPITRYVPLLLLIYFFFIAFSAFQNINSGVYDIDAYKLFFDEAGDYTSLNAYLEAHDQEFLYLTINWLLHHVTDSFNIVLLIFFSFIYYALIKFFYTTKQKPSFILFLSVFCLVFPIVVQSYCILRTGLSIAAGLLVFSELQIKSSNKVNSFFRVFKIIVWTVVSVGCHTLGLFILVVLVMNFIYQKGSLKIFLFIFFIFFIFGYFAKPILMKYLLFYKRFLLYAGLEAKPAYKTYIANLFLLGCILYKKKSFFSLKNIGLHFVIFMCSFFIYDFELLMTSIMFRMIYFTRPSTVIVIANIWNIYKPKKKEIIIPLLVRFALIIYVTFNFYGFLIAMPRYGLDFYKLGGIYDWL